MKQTRLKIDGMTCAGCVASVQNALRRVPGVRLVNVDLPGAHATVEHDDMVAPAVLAGAVHDAGFDAEAPTS